MTSLNTLRLGAVVFAVAAPLTYLSLSHSTATPAASQADDDWRKSTVLCDPGVWSTDPGMGCFADRDAESNEGGPSRYADRDAESNEGGPSRYADRDAESNEGGASRLA